MFKDKVKNAIKKPKKSTYILSFLVTAFAISSVYFGVQNFKNENAISEANSKIATLRAAASTASSEHAAALETCENKNRHTAEEGAAAISDLNEKIAAFAKQAAACELIRKKINLKGAK